VSSGYDTVDLLISSLWALGGSLAIFCLALSKKYFSTLNINSVTVLIYSGIIVGAAFQGWAYHSSQSRPWSLEWSQAVSNQLFEVPKIVSYKENPIERRPARKVIGGGSVDDILAARNSSPYNSCWYEGTFCLLGYNNLKLSIPHKTLYDALSSKVGGDDLLRFVSGSQQTLISKTGVSPLSLLGTSTNAPYISDVPEVSATPVLYQPGKVVYEVFTKEPVRVLENEIWWDGWTLELCDSEGCLPSIETKPNEFYLRYWDVPPGHWRAELTFHPKGSGASYMLAVAGLLILAIWMVWISVPLKRAITKFSV